MYTRSCDIVYVSDKNSYPRTVDVKNNAYVSSVRKKGQKVRG